MKYTFIAAMLAACTLALAACGEKKHSETPPPAVVEVVPESAPQHAAPEVHVHEAAPSEPAKN
ncbi:MAG: hypothetical protein H0X26_07000 [Alphaproteobacteria bacterium]|nr:hypothetical protein [Alphaproteobacteria bacterium]